MEKGYNKKFFTIEEVAKILGISKQTIKRYERKKIFPPARRHAINGWRIYTDEDVENLKRIYESSIIK